MLLSAEHSLLFYVMMMGGFFLALLSQRFVFVNADLKSEVTTGLILMIISFLIRFSGNEDAIRYMSPVMAGCGIGIIGARFLLFFIKLSRHCQRNLSKYIFPFMGVRTLIRTFYRIRFLLQKHVPVVHNIHCVFVPGINYVCVFYPWMVYEE